MSINGLKWCTTCKTHHDPTEFGKDRTRSDGLRAACRSSRHVTRKTIAERFAAKTKRSLNGCLLWTGSTYPSGYGSFWLDGQLQPAHRVAWMLSDGAIPGDTWVLHRCDVRLCVEREHLFLGDRAANVADMDAKGRRAPCDGERNPRAKLTAAQIREIRSLAGEHSQRVLARRYGVSKALIRKILHNEIWTREYPRQLTGAVTR